MACEPRPAQEILQRYENFIKQQEAKQLTNQPISLEEIESLRTEILLPLQAHTLRPGEIALLEALNTRYQIIRKNLQFYFPSISLPPEVIRTLHLKSDDWKQITATNIGSYYRVLLQEVRKAKREKKDYKKSLHYLERYKLLYSDSLSVDSLLYLEKMALRIKGAMHE